jgi:hypothetical protein
MAAVSNADTRIEVFERNNPFTISAFSASLRNVIDDFNAVETRGL